MSGRCSLIILDFVATNDLKIVLPVDTRLRYHGVQFPRFEMYYKTLVLMRPPAAVSTASVGVYGEVFPSVRGDPHVTLAK